MFFKGAAFWVLGTLYCAFTFYLAVVFIAKEEDVDFDQVRFGAGIIFGVSFLLSVLAYCLPAVSILLWLVILAVAVFLTYALEVGLIVKQATITTVLFLVMFLPGYFGICHLLNVWGM